jgi:hypothetical protein
MIKMMSIIHYISACRRLKESEKTVMMMGGEEECNDMILGQREMLVLEKEYYRVESIKFTCISIVVVLISLISYIIFK